VLSKTVLARSGSLGGSPGGSGDDLDLALDRYGFTAVDRKGVSPLDSLTVHVLPSIVSRGKGPS